MDNEQQQVLNTAESVLMERQPATTKAGTVRKRIMWISQMNEDIICCYMRCTKVETELTAYGQNMYTQFVELYREIVERLSEQNVADRRRAIITQWLLTEIEINEIKNQVKQELQQDQSM
jgi:heterodisulfide reductase subunit B